MARKKKIYGKCGRCGKKITKDQSDGLCYACRTRLEIEEDLKSMVVPPKRKCHDCGAPTDDFRCEKCREKIEAGRQQIIIIGGVEHECLNVGDWIYG